MTEIYCPSCGRKGMERLEGTILRCPMCESQINGISRPVNWKTIYLSNIRGKESKRNPYRL